MFEPGARVLYHAIPLKVTRSRGYKPETVQRARDAAPWVPATVVRIAGGGRYSLRLDDGARRVARARDLQKWPPDWATAVLERPAKTEAEILATRLGERA